MNCLSPLALGLCFGLTAANCWAEEVVERKALPKGALDHLLENDKIWGATLDDFGRVHTGLGFSWLSSAKEGVRSVDRILSLDGQRVGETVIRQDDGYISQLSISLYNRGDNGDVSIEQFRIIEQRWLQFLNRITGSAPEDRSGAKDAVADQTRLVWYKGGNAYLLESSVTRSPEFLRIRMAPKPSGAAYLGTGASNAEAAHRSDLRQNVGRDEEGGVFIKNVPMVDQGEKGYCAVATAERVFRYYGVPVDQHDMAQVSKSSAALGTSPEMMIDALGDVAAKVKLRPQTVIDWDEGKFIREVENYNRAAKRRNLKTYDIRNLRLDTYYATIDPDLFREIRSKGTQFRTFKNEISRSIDQGIPMLWGVELGVFPEPAIPQARGGHMRLIIGYNSRTDEVIFSDSWGEGHAKKSMPMADAYAITNGLYKISPTH